VASNDDPLPPLILLPTSPGAYDLTTDGDGCLDTTTFGDDSPITALYKMNELVRSGRSRVEVYNEVCHISGKTFDYGSSDDLDGQLCGHMDGGSMVNTCHCSALFWGKIHSFKKNEHPILQVANKFEHYAQGWGTICVPLDATYGYTNVCCLYMPTLEAVILLPDYSGKFLHCRGYVSISNFDGQGCSITLCHCKCSLQDIHFPLTSVCGLLFTRPLLLPLAALSPDLNKLHVKRIELDDDTTLIDNTHHKCVCSDGGNDNCHCSDHVCSPCDESLPPPVSNSTPHACHCSGFNETARNSVAAA